MRCVVIFWKPNLSAHPSAMCLWQEHLWFMTSIKPDRHNSGVSPPPVATSLLISFSITLISELIMSSPIVGSLNDWSMYF
ncbi:hypothetical protein BpHYR1_009077 [Brachionus plicatilis]|uniref:Uncharacterized protein n=1 Tax=Brachionus plicatilis TaxID=10195 RepID=A0A3M7QMP3_BRAPC|nr:hypothetical protein BpHYR1_009077 [Brachionus plicatilis]